VVFSTHVMQHAERLCDQVVLLARGRKVFDGSVAEPAAPRRESSCSRVRWRAAPSRPCRA